MGIDSITGKKHSITAQNLMDIFNGEAKIHPDTKIVKALRPLDLNGDGNISGIEADSTSQGISLEILADRFALNMLSFDLKGQPLIGLNATNLNYYTRHTDTQHIPENIAVLTKIAGENGIIEGDELSLYIKNVDMVPWSSKHPISSSLLYNVLPPMGLTAFAGSIGGSYMMISSLVVGGIVGLAMWLKGDYPRGSDYGLNPQQINYFKPST